MAKSRSIGGIYASLSLRDKGFKSGLKSAGASLKKFGMMAGAAAAAGVAAGAAALTAGTLRTLDHADALGDLAAQTGVAVGDMMKLQQAYKEGGRAAEMTGKDIGKMQKSIVGAASGGEDPFAALGLSAEKLLRMDPAQQFSEIGAAIMRMSNPAERTAKAMEIFGKGGMGLTTVFEGIPAATIALGRMPEVAQEFASRMGEANDLIGNLPLKSDQFFMGFTAGIVDSILPGLNSINEFDFTTLGQNFGNALTSAIKEVSIAFNTLLDVATGQDSMGAGGGNKYREAQNALDAQDKADFLERDLAKRLAAAMKQVETRATISDRPAEKMAAARLPEIQKIQANEYQRRGLSVAGVGARPQESKQIDILEDIRESLKKIAARNGTPVW